MNPYLGTDGITPFVDAATANDKDIFVLVRTSNPSSSELQELELASGERVYEHVADLVEGWGRRNHRQERQTEKDTQTHWRIGTVASGSGVLDSSYSCKKT